MRRTKALKTDRLHLILMLALTFSTGIVDAVGYLGLDRVFTGNMTGNVVILGMALAGGSHLPVLGPALALLFFMVGAAMAGRVLRNAAPGWSGKTSGMFLLVALGLATLAVIDVFISSPVSELTGSIVTSGMALVMGVQAASARRLKVTDVTTVVVTSTITALAAESRLAGGSGAYWQRRALAVALILLGALLGALTLNIGLWLGLGSSAAITLTVVIIGHRRCQRDSQASVMVDAVATSS